MNKKLRLWVLAILAFSGGLARAETGVTDREVTVGQFAAFSGPAGQLGQRMRAGIDLLLKLAHAGE
ncbi:MAG: hypothetical protein H0X13_05970 [Ramlibacter sp.]|nr:hypothetical protein [Ramlibacter sp.]